MLNRSIPRLADQAAASLPDAPLRRCDDCQLNLGTRPGDTLRAAFACPRFGKPRHGVESRCAAFVPKVAVLVLAASLAGCSLTPAQRWGVVAGVLVAGAIAAHEHDSGKLIVPTVPTPGVDCSRNPELCR